MNSEYYIRLANEGLPMPIGSDLVLHERPNPEAVVVDGERLGKVIEDTARCRRRRAGRPYYWRPSFTAATWVRT